MEYLLSSNRSFPLVKWLVEKLDWQHVNLVNSLQSCQLMTNDLCLLIGNLLQQLCGPSHHHVCGSKQNKLAQFWTQFRDTELTRAHVPIQTSLVNKSAKWKLTHSLTRPQMKTILYAVICSCHVVEGKPPRLTSGTEQRIHQRDSDLDLIRLSPLTWVLVQLERDKWSWETDTIMQMMAMIIMFLNGPTKVRNSACSWEVSSNAPNVLSLQCLSVHSHKKLVNNLHHQYQTTTELSSLQQHEH